MADLVLIDSALKQLKAELIRVDSAFGRAGARRRGAATIDEGRRFDAL